MPFLSTQPKTSNDLEFRPEQKNKSKEPRAIETRERLSDRRKPPSHSCPLSYPLSLCLGSPSLPA